MKKILPIVLTAALLWSCSENERSLTLSPSSLTLHHDESQYVHIIGEPTGVEWSSDDDFVAKWTTEPSKAIT